MHGVFEPFKTSNHKGTEVSIGELRTGKTRGKDLFGPHLYYASQSRSKEFGEPPERQTSGGEVTRASVREVFFFPFCLCLSVK